ncbi:hypothetical protein FMUND_4853 [Fusarium mundagurra]|uniref:Uncharacterized protein n=1 Tax=Fusarium mundagurra TaxID=1567541 RepID=A0A8H5YUV0_9HYPO|nr:hypothetical protein FMUND_4853 [Fusarium mundagurra]
METNDERNAIILGGREFPPCIQEDDSLASLDGCTYAKVVSFDNWVHQEACRRWEIIKHPLTDLRVEPLWHRNEGVIEYAMNYRFDWDRGFLNIESDNSIEWCDLESLAIATLHRSAKFRGDKDKLGDIPDNVSADGHRDFIARASLRLDRRVAQSIPLWHPENQEVDALTQTSNDNIPGTMNRVDGDTIPKPRTIPDSCIKLVGPEHLEAAKLEYKKQENNQQDHLAPFDQWADDPIHSIIHAHMHRYYIVCERKHDKTTGAV